jgi:hypothetical protein
MRPEQGFLEPLHLKSEQDELAKTSTLRPTMGFIDPLRIPRWIIPCPMIPDLPDVSTIIESVKKLTRPPESSS